MRLKYLYAILCPDTKETKYVGQTFHPQQRLKEHIRGPLEVDKWIRSLIEQGQKPLLVILDRKRKEYNLRERQLIIEQSPDLNKKIPVNI